MIAPKKITIKKSTCKRNENKLIKIARGFSLIEIMVTVAIISILTAIALPSLNSFLIKMRVDNEISELQRLLLTARNAAINEGRDVSVCPLAGNACSGVNNWSGIIGVVSPDGVLKEKEAITDGDILKFPFNGLTYNAIGRLTINIANPPPNAVFSYCPQNNFDYARAILVIVSGRTYVSFDENNDGIDESRAGVGITCP